MKKVVVSVLGEDRPGIVHAVSKALDDLSCPIVQISQTILQTEFAAIFVAAMPDPLTPIQVQERLGEQLADMALKISTRELTVPATPPPVDSEPFVITLRGPDRSGIISGVTGVLYGFNVNINHLNAIADPGDPEQVINVFEVAVPKMTERQAFRAALAFKAEELGMELSLQHRDIFDAIHRV